jgi:hypothetical protein
MRPLVIMAVLTGIAYAVALPPGSRVEGSPPPQPIEPGLTSLNDTGRPITHLTLCRPRKKPNLVCGSDSSAVNPTCGFTEWCKNFMYPYRDMRICVEDGVAYWGTECCFKALRDSCDGKEPTVFIDPWIKK